jgi:ribonuclease BN (tRNA processing enzyme)
VRLTVVGSSPAWPNPGGAQSGYLVEANGQRLLLDCGAGVLPRLRTRDGWPRVDAVVITHFHLDHWADLVPWVWGALFGPGRDAPKPELWVARGGIGHLEHLGSHFGWPEMFGQAFELREFEGGTPFVAAGFTVHPTRVLHYSLETYGLSVGNGDATLAYSGDSGPCDELVDVARGADVFLCEATLARPNSEGDERGHLAVEEAVAAFRASGAGRLVLTHRPSELPVADGLELAWDGLEIEVG